MESLLRYLRSHFSRFRDSEASVLEIGVFSGGSLDMWRDYFGARSEIIGVDIAPECLKYAGDGVRIFIGDQADRDFWKRVTREVPAVDIVIDDGGHEPEQQIVTLEELLPVIRPGGIYLCEDVHGAANRFSLHVQGLAQQLNSMDHLEANPDNADRRLVSATTAIQSIIRAIHSSSRTSDHERSRG